MKYLPKEEYVAKKFRINMSTKKMADVMYGYIMCRCTGLSTLALGVYGYTRSQNSRNGVTIMIQIHPDVIDKFEQLTDIQLETPPKIKLN